MESPLEARRASLFPDSSGQVSQTSANQQPINLVKMFASPSIDDHMIMTTVVHRIDNAHGVWCLVQASRFWSELS